MQIEFVNEKTVEAEAGMTLLQTALAHGINHTHVCGGNARCSTCRVLVTKGLENLETRNEAEQSLASRRGFTDEIRLACQTRAKGPVSIRRLVLDHEDVKEISQIRTAGRETNLAVLFSDIRSFTPFSEEHLPYDVVHILNRYFQSMGDCVYRNGGIIDKYIGDGLMALFGLKAKTAEEACLSAVRAGSEMLRELDSINNYLKRTFDVEFKIGIGINYGELIVGEMGHPQKVQFTALGDNVNMAARIESTTKRANAKLLISDSVYENVKTHIHKGRVFSAPLKGKLGRHKLYEVTGVKESAGTTELYQFPLLQKAEIAEGTMAFWFDTSLNDYAFHAGQFADLTIPDLEGKEVSTHTFSIASSPTRSDSLVFVSRMRNTPYKNALSKLEEGAPVYLSAPAGNLGWFHNTLPAVMIAGGIGITPLRSMIQLALEEKPDQKITLFYSNRKKAQAAFLDELEEWASDHPNFELVATLTEERPIGWHHEAGRIDKAMLQKYVHDLSGSVFYIAGPARMSSGIRETLLSLGISDSRIHTEEFLGY